MNPFSQIRHGSRKRWSVGNPARKASDFLCRCTDAGAAGPSVSALPESVRGERPPGRCRQVPINLGRTELMIWLLLTAAWTNDRLRATTKRSDAERGEQQCETARAGAARGLAAAGLDAAFVH